MHDYRELARLMERTVHKYIQLEKKPHEFMSGVFLTQSEIHTIAIVGDHPNINVTELAKERGVTKGAASQMVYKLVDKGYINKTTSPTSDTEVCLTLTGGGEIAYEQHKEYHEKSGTAFLKLLQDMPEETQDYLVELLKTFETTIDLQLLAKK